MKEVNIKINADTKQAEANLDKLGSSADKAAQEMLGVAETSFTVAESITGSFAIATGAIGLFAGENEKMQKIATKANSVIAISLGVRQLAEQKSNITIVAGTVATKLNAAANTVTAATMRALGIATNVTTASFKAMKMALISTGIGALIVGVGMLVSKLTSAKKKTDEFTKAQEDLNNQIKESQDGASKMISLNEKLLRAETELEKTIIHKKIAYEEEKEKIDALVEAKEREDAMNLKFLKNGGDATMLLNVANEEYEKQINLISELDKEVLNLEKSLKKKDETQKEDNTETEEKTIPLTELQKSILIEEVNLRDNLQQKKISQHQFDVEMLEQEIFMLHHKLESEKLTEDEIFLLKQEIAHKEIDLNQEKLDEIQRAKEKAAEDQKLLDEQEAERNQILADSRQSNVDSAKMMFDSIGGLMKEGSKAQKTFALASIATDTATAISSLVGGTEKAALSAAAPFLGTPAYPFVYGSTKVGFYASGVAQILNNVAQAKAILQGGESGGGSAGGGGGGGVTYTAPFVPETAEQGTPTVTGDGEGTPVQAFVVSTQMTNAQALDEELQLQSTL
jgi:hypothetical protein